MPERNRHYRSPRGGAFEARIPGAEPLQGYRLRRLLWGPDDPEAEEIRPAGCDRECGDFGAAAVHDGELADRPLLEGYRARQDRVLQGSKRCRDVAQALDRALYQLQ